MPSRILAVLCACLALVPAARAELVDRVAAVVNNDIITLSEVQRRAALDLAKIDQDPDASARAKRRAEALKRALDVLIDEKLVDEELRELKLNIDDKQVDEGIAEVAKSYNLNDDQLKEALAREGYTWSEYRETMRKQLGRYKLIQEKVRKTLKITDREVKTEYARMSREEGKDFEIHVRHLLVQVGPAASIAEVERARAKAEALEAEARTPGVDFAQLARQKSEGSSAADGGDLGFFRRGTMEQTFEQVAFSLPPGEVSDPVRTRVGFHVIKVEERRAVPVKPLSEIRAELEGKLRRDQTERATAQYMQTLRQSAALDVKI